MQECLQRIVRRDRCPLVQLAAKELGTPDVRGAMNRAPGYWAGTVATTDQQGLMDRIASEHELNESRRAALAAALDHHLTLIQG